MTLSITIIGHNEGYHLEELLPTLDWADEVVYVDCESNDDSLEIASKNGCKTFSRPNDMNLNRNKSFAMENSNGEWIFYLDPDERISQRLAEEILSRLAAGPSEVAFKLDRRNYFFGHWLKRGGQYPDTQLRLFRRGKAHFPNRHVHEKLAVDGKIGKLQQAMAHYSYLTISQFIQKFDFYTSFEAKFLQQQGEKVSGKNHFRYFLWKPFTRFWKRYLLKGGFRDGVPGFFAAVFDAVNFMVRYFKLWELQKKTPAE